ncbi:hypothetical protein GQX74_006308 [Glossina fuscipes]|nr:hypothetical protein GQX74_006308 [Glossina fuscipes]
MGSVCLIQLIGVKATGEVLSIKKSLHDNTTYDGVVDPTNILTRPIAYFLLNLTQTIHPNRIVSRPNGLQFELCVPDRTQLHSPADNSSNCRIRRILGERIEAGPPMCCEDIERTGRAEMGLGIPKWRSNVPVPNKPVRLERTPGRSRGSELNLAISGPPPSTLVPAAVAPRGILPTAGLL